MRDTLSVTVVTYEVVNFQELLNDVNGNITPVFRSRTKKCGCPTDMEVFIKSFSSIQQIIIK